MGKEYQHIVPQVYLKGFGFQKPEFNNRWFVSVKDKYKKEWQDRDIEKFLGEKALYDLEETIELPKNILEKQLHGIIENRIPKIIKYLDENKSIHPAIHLDIAETTANFLCRSKRVLTWIEKIMKKQPRDFWDHISKGKEVFEDEEDREHIFLDLLEMNEKDRRNNLMVHFMLHVKLILSNANLIVFRNPGPFYMFTSDNPVQVWNAGYGELIKPNCEIFFALTRDYLIYFYWDSSKCAVKSVQPILQNGAIIDISEEFADYYATKVVPTVADQFIISPLDKTHFES